MKIINLIVSGVVCFIGGGKLVSDITDFMGWFLIIAGIITFISACFSNTSVHIGGDRDSDHRDSSWGDSGSSSDGGSGDSGGGGD